MRATRRPRWPAWARLAVTIVLLGFLLSRIELLALAREIRGALGVWLALALASNALLLVASTLKWDRLLRDLGIVRRFGLSLRLYTIGFCFSSFLPGTAGGDVVRWYLASPSAAERVKVAASILAERAIGVFALVVLCVLAIARDPERLALAPLLMLLGGVALLLAGAALATFQRRFALARLRGLLRPLQGLRTALGQLSGGALLAAVAYSAVFYLAGGLTFFLIARAFGAELGFLDASAATLLVCLVTLLPISLGGLGLAQVGDVYVLAALGVDAPTALGMSLLRQAMSYAYALVGAALFLGTSGHPSVAELESLARGSARLPAADSPQATS